MKTVFARSEEQADLRRLYHSGKAEFVVVYGRRRVGKTHLVRELFSDELTFYHTALSPTDIEPQRLNEQQLQNFCATLSRCGMEWEQFPRNWIDAFEILIDFLEQQPKNKRLVVFLDELPWLDTPRSGFLSAFEHFWNGWGAGKKNLMLIVCGSATSWVTDKIINNHGGLYGRTTYEIHLSPFTLKETEEYLLSQNILFDRYDILQTYMVFGGIPYYLNYLEPGMSLAQCIDKLFFRKNGRLRFEMENMYRSIFIDADKYIKLVRLLAKRREGFSRKQIIESSQNLSSGGGLSDMLRVLEQSDFITSYTNYQHSAREVYYRLNDMFSLFYMRFVETADSQQTFWQDNQQSPSLNAWRGYAFEQICFMHQQQLKQALGIAGVSTRICPWKSKNDEHGAQIDMLIIRSDRIINLCEIKYSINTFTIDKQYDELLRNKMQVFIDETKCKYSVHLTMITTYGISQNIYANHVQKSLTMDSLFL